MKKFLDRLITGFAIAFAIPTILILISWNAIPGDRLYSIKAELEDLTLAFTANTPLAPSFSLEFTNRRFNEATKLLAKEGSTVGYELLVAEAQQTQAIVLNKQDVKNGSQLIEKIEEYQAEIEEKQVEIQRQTPPTPLTTPPTTSLPTPSPLVIQKPVATSAPTETAKQIIVTKPVTVVIKQEEPVEVLTNLEETHKELGKIKEKIKKELPETASPRAREAVDKDKDKKEKD
ncbi:MAG: DUF5667 domain-containing protein [Microgenomates group bacterium]